MPKLIDQFNEVVVNEFNMIDFTKKVKEVLLNEIIHCLDTHDVHEIEDNAPDIRELINNLETLKNADTLKDMESIMFQTNFHVQDSSELKDKVEYYGLYDTKQKGFKGGFAGKDITKLLEKSAERICDMTAMDNQPIIFADPIDDILTITGYEIHRISEDDYNKIINSDAIFLSEVVDNVSIGEPIDLEAVAL